MDAVIAGLPPAAVAAAAAVMFVACFVKGVVGFAMPMIAISGLGSFLPPELALAAIILPILATNVSQSLRQGWRAAWGSVRRFRVLLATLILGIAATAQLVPAIPQALFFALLGVPITLWAAAQLAGLPIRLPTRPQRPVEAAVGAVAGVIGGISGVWGPPILIYLLSIGTAKAENLRVQGVTFLFGGIVLCAAHLRSGVLNGATLPLSALLVAPAMLGLIAGYAVQDRLDQTSFRRWTLVVLMISGLNLLRRALAG
jgi:uncharacterized membrane protein YfcA